MLDEANRRGKSFFVIVSIVTAIAVVYSLFFNKPKYDAVCTFMINDDGGQGLNTIMNFASQIGVGLPQTGITGDKVQDLLESKSIITKSILWKKSNQEIFANELIDSLNLQKKLKKYLLINDDFHFKNIKEEALTPLEFKASDLICKIIKESYLNIKINKSEIIECSILTSNQECSKLLCDNLVRNASNFYISKEIEKNKNLLVVTQARFDSIQQVLFQKENMVYKGIDASKLNIRQAGSFDLNVLKREVTMLTNMYSQTASNIDRLKFEIESKTPIFQLIDQPHLPIEPQKLKLTLILFLGLFSTIFLFVVYLIFVKIGMEVRK